MDERHSGIVDIPELLAEMRAREAASSVRPCQCNMHESGRRSRRVVVVATTFAAMSLAANAFAFGRAYAPPVRATTDPPAVVATIAKTPRPPTKARAPAPTAPAPKTLAELVPPPAPPPPAALRRPKVAVASAELPPVAPALSATVVAPSPPAPPDLESAMRIATGAPKPASTTEAPPESPARQMRPAQGAIVAALRGVQGSAQACLETDDAPRVVAVTFVSTGTVASVETQVVDAKSGCIVSALRVAKVEPFAETSFRARITIRPR